MHEPHNKPVFYDTTLRDGTQAAGANVSLNDKCNIIELLIDVGIPYIEAGYPGSNPKDKALFERLQDIDCKSSKIVAFGSTRRVNTNARTDQQLNNLVLANTPAITLVAKSWDFHVTQIINTTLKENLKLIADSVAFCKDHDKEVILDAEHFFDGFRHNSGYAIECLHAAKEAGCDIITLCDTNGGQLPEQISHTVTTVRAEISMPLGIHCHNDCELAVANTLSGWHSGAQLIQGTFNGYGERCGNANLSTLLPLLQLKYQQPVLCDDKLANITSIARKISNYFNLPLNHYAAFVGQSAFAHKGGLHVSAINKYSHSYEHVKPECIGNERKILISELSGKSNVIAQMQHLSIEVDDVEKVTQEIKALDEKGIDLEEADGSLGLLLAKHNKSYRAPFELLAVSSHMQNQGSTTLCQGTVKLNIEGEIIQTIAEASGPVEAIDKAFRLALASKFPDIANIKLTDYKVRIIDPQQAAAATTRVWVEARLGDKSWSTVGCSPNIIDASSQAIKDSFEYYLIKHSHQKQSHQGSKENDHKAA